MRANSMWIVGVILLALVGVILWVAFRPVPSSAGNEGPAGKSGTRSPSSAARALRDAGPAHAGKTVRTLPESAPEPTHTPDQLKDFLLPEFSVMEVSLEDALAQLFDLYHQVCSETGEQAVAFSYRIDGTPAPSISVKTRSSFLATLRVLATFAGCDLTRDGSHLRFTAAAPDPSAPRVTQSIKVPPTFTSDLLSFSNRPSVDPFSTLTEQMRAMHLIGNGSTAKFLPASATLVLKASADDRRRFMGFYEEVLTRPPVLFRSQQKIIEATEPITLPGFSPPAPEGAITANLLTDLEVQEFLRTVNTTAGAEIRSQPTVVSRQGEPATVKVAQSYQSPSQLAGGANGSPGSTGTGFFPTNPEPTWIGQQSEITADGYGFANRTQASFESRSLSKQDAGSQELPSIRSAISESSVTLHDTDWHVLHDIDSDGTHRYILLNIQRVGPGGAPVPTGR